MHRKFLGLATIVCGVVLGSLIGCSSDSGGTSGKALPTADQTGSAKNVKIGFIVKLASDPWFQTEFKFARQAAKDLGFELVESEARDGQAVLTQIDSLKSAGAQGVIICSPDVKLGAAIVARAKENNMKLMSVDDRLVDGDGKPLTDVPHLGIDAKNIGKSVGEAIAAEMKKRGWKPEEVGALVLTIDELETARNRIEGATEALVAAGFLKNRIYTNAWKKFDVSGAMDSALPVLNQHPEVKYWIAFTSNDDGVLGIVRATENKGIPAANVIGIGINGTSIDDFKKDSGFFASVLLSAKTHGYDTCKAMYEWITKGTMPPMETYTKGKLIDRSNYVEVRKEEGLD